MATYKHKSIRRFGIGDFTFKNFLLVTQSEAADAQFRELMAEQPIRVRNSIVQINEEAMAALEQSMNLGERIVRGAQSTAQVDSGVIGAAGAKAIAAEGAGGPTPEALQMLEEHAIATQVDVDASAAAGKAQAPANPLAGLSLLKK